MTTLYEQDTYQWSLDQANLLRNGDFEKLDIEHLSEEIETLYNSEKRALRSQLARLMTHLLKIKFQPEKHTVSWDCSVDNAREEIFFLLKDNPSFKRLLAEYISHMYRTAARNASTETGLNKKIFPEECPWTIEELLKEEGNGKN